jgi:hypothetical protein
MTDSKQEGDETRTCCDCQQPFVLTAGEQAFYLAKGLTLPKRCPKCRAFKKQQREQATGW